MNTDSAGLVHNNAPRRSTARDQIKDLILARGLQPGDPMPTEVELCEQLNVSRSSVREAIRALSTLGIVEVRHGHGTFVGTMSLNALVETLVFRGVLVPGDELRALHDVVEIRRILDISMAETIVASMAGTENVDLHQLADEMITIAQQGETFPHQDRLFHAKLLARLENQLVGQLVTAFWDVHTAVVPKLGLTVAADLVQTAQAHEQMLLAAEKGDVEGFKLAVQTHYEPIERALEVNDS